MQLQNMARSLHWAVIDSCNGFCDTRDLQLLSQRLRVELRGFDEAVMDLRPASTLDRRLSDASNSLERLHDALQRLAVPQVQYNVNKYGSVGYSTSVASQPGNTREIDSLIHQMEDVIAVTAKDLSTCQHGLHNHPAAPGYYPSVPSLIPNQPGQFPTQYNSPNFNNYNGVTKNHGPVKSYPSKTVSVGGVKLTFGIK
jgi:hypothetical protein